MYFLVGKAFQNQSIMMRAFPGALQSCRCATTATSTNKISGFSISTSTTGRRDYNRWTKPASIQGSKLLSKSESSVSTTLSKRQSSSGDHVTLWTAERVLSGVLVPLVPLAFVMPSAPVEAALAFCLTLHSHWGIEAIVVDYVRPSVFGEVIPKVALAAVYGLSAMTLGGLLYFIYSDVGLVTAIKMLWKL